MRIVYLTPTLSSAAGMERVLHNKVCYLARKGTYDLTVITSDQRDTPLFYKFPNNVRIVDLGINYADSYTLPPLKRALALRKKKNMHRKALMLFLKENPADILVTLYPSDATFAPMIHDGSKKILEFHSNRFFRLNQGYHGLHKVIAKFRTWQDYITARQFDRLVVLTKEGAEQWGHFPHLAVIPNSVTHIPDNLSRKTNSRQVIAVGRLIYEKGFDRLLYAWAQLPLSIRREWTLHIYGQGPLENDLQSLILQLGIQESASICPPTSHIFQEYANSAFLVMSSRSEGFGMVMIEALSCGTPVISYDFKCGPKEIIQDKVNGLLVPDGDVSQLSEAMELLITNPQMRDALAKNAKTVYSSYSEETVMSQWEALFKDLTKR
ncbi:MAG: glycosyltransferase family 4 protein [Bacteroidales bacterium]|nr:glycosyltransferase family 4 protein [Bacteroidales bacterium]